MNQSFNKVKEFQEIMQQPVADQPTALLPERVAERYGFMREELNEFAMSDKLVDQVDGIIDLLYLAIGTLVEMGVRPEELFNIVHEANMSKLWEDGKPRFDVNNGGKIIKPPSFVRPEPLLEQEIQRQKEVYEDALQLQAREGNA
ncbi:HAD family hydrolase [Jeotgalibacillus proteolyticus]|nr:HAD family hydrolase [Jeotgalibacillus proteolyticus]